VSRLRQRLQVLLHVEDTPHRIALAFGIGVFIAFFPLLGIHTAMALALSFAFRLSRVAILLGTWVNNPWTIAPMLMGGTLLGCALLGVTVEEPLVIDWSLRGRALVDALLTTLRPYLWPYVIGNTVAGIGGGLVGYALLRSFLERRRALAGTQPAPGA
jgi:uncharacterized protein (DUF2062 family)